MTKGNISAAAVVTRQVIDPGLPLAYFFHW